MRALVPVEATPDTGPVSPPPCSSTTPKQDPSRMQRRTMST